MDYKELLNKTEYEFLRTNPRLGSRIMLLGVSGSHGYGTSRKAILHFFAASGTESICGIMFLRRHFMRSFRILRSVFVRRRRMTIGMIIRRAKELFPEGSEAAIRRVLT